MKSPPPPRITGRFAPSPTGPLHFGTLVAALGSYLLARQADGQWLLRIEDIDTPRVIPGSAQQIMRLLEDLGLTWDGEVVFQSERQERYQQVLEQLDSLGLLYECSCSRREILASAPHPGEEGPVYPGTCRQGPAGGRPARSTRLRVPIYKICFDDLIYGASEQHLLTAVGDFVLRRADGLVAYQLAVVVDDLDAGVNQVVRGSDLLSSTARQIYLYSCLGEAPPVYVHLPLALGHDGEKISKRHGETMVVTRDNGASELWRVLEFLQQQPPAELLRAEPREILAWALENFEVDKIEATDRIMV